MSSISGYTRGITDWYDGNQKPYYIGLYQRRAKKYDNVMWSWWNGCQWGYNCVTMSDAVQHCGFTSNCQYLPWRGLKEKKDERICRSYAIAGSYT